MLGQEATTLRESVIMVEAPLGWRNFTQEMSPRTLVWTAPAFRQGTGCPICELHFWKA